MTEPDGQRRDGFKSAVARGADWGAAARACLAALDELPEGANLGFLYATAPLAPDLSSLLTLLRQTSGIEHWVGTVGAGVMGNSEEIYEEPAIALLAGHFPEGSFQVFQPMSENLTDFHDSCGAWLARNRPLLGVVHGDPRNPLLPSLIAGLADETATFLVGGLSSSEGAALQLADRVTEGGLSGVLFGESLAVATGLTQGCRPIGPARRIGAAERNIVMTLDERPALEALLEDLGLTAKDDWARPAQDLMAGLPVTGSDTGDYLVRNLMGIDPDRGWLAVGELVEAGQRLLFCRRDRAAAEADLRRMLREVKGRIPGRPRGGLYFSCVARGARLFGRDSAELAIVREELGDLPLAGFFANGEICNNRLYGYTGVLTLFL